MFKFNKVKVPTNQIERLVTIETWVVSWTKRTGEFHSETKKCYQAFTNKEDAEKFKKALENAHELIGNTSGTHVSIENQQSGLQ